MTTPPYRLVKQASERAELAAAGPQRVAAQLHNATAGAQLFNLFHSVEALVRMCAAKRRGDAPFESHVGSSNCTVCVIPQFSGAKSSQNFTFPLDVRRKPTNTIHRCAAPVSTTQVAFSHSWQNLEHV